MMSKQKKNDGNEPMRYLLVQLTLTSGEVRTFYVKAINQFEANKKADDYAEFASNEKLFETVTGKFRLLP